MPVYLAHDTCPKCGKDMEAAYTTRIPYYTWALCLHCGFTQAQGNAGQLHLGDLNAERQARALFPLTKLPRT